MKAYEASKNKTEFAVSLGLHYLNGRTSKKIDAIAAEFSLDLEKFKNTRFYKNRKYERITKICPACGEIFEALQGEKREKKTCSYKCSNLFFVGKRITDESKAKTSASLNAFHVKNGTSRVTCSTICVGCGSKFETHNANRKYCKRSCFELNRVVEQETRDLLQFQAKKRVAEGRHAGWKSRAKCNRSWAENYVEKLLNDRGLIRGTEFEVEYRQNKWFIDFAFLEKKIALEIDGAQHKLPERQAKDQERDAWLTNNGWTVIRIPWKRVDKKVYEELSVKIDDILTRAGLRPDQP